MIRSLPDRLPRNTIVICVPAHSGPTSTSRHSHNAAIMLPPTHARRWQRMQADLPLRVFLSNGVADLVVPGRATEISPGGMCFCAGVELHPGDLLEIEFDEPVCTRVMGVIRNRTGYTFGMEFLSPLPTEEKH